MRLKNEAKRLVLDCLHGRRIRALVSGTPDLTENGIAAMLDSAVGFIQARRADRGYGFTPDDGGPPDIYSTVYAVCLLGLVGRLDLLDRAAVTEFILTRQDDDGLFRDPVLISPQAETGQGWGWQHLLPHVLIALDYLKAVPRKPFAYAWVPFQTATPRDWILDRFSGPDALTASNHFFNLSTALQFARDRMDDEKARSLAAGLVEGCVADILPRFLDGKGEFRRDLSERVKTVYHLLPPLLFDGALPDSFAAPILCDALATQNRVGGFGAGLVSNGCEDMDSVYLLASLRHPPSDDAVRSSLRRFMRYVLSNQAPDRGFYFRPFYAFCYGGCSKLSAPIGQGEMFSTWFRILAIAFAARRLGWAARDWHFSAAPGYQTLPDDGRP